MVTIGGAYIRVVALFKGSTRPKDYLHDWVGPGVAHIGLGHTIETEAALRRAIALDPGNAVALRSLAAVLLRSG